MLSRSEIGNFWMGPNEPTLSYLKKKLEEIMPHDKNDKLLKVGDKVTVEFVVAEVYAGEDYCNVRLQVEGENAPHNVTTGVTLNTKQTTLVE